MLTILPYFRRITSENIAKCPTIFVASGRYWSYLFHISTAQTADQTTQIYVYYSLFLRYWTKALQNSLEAKPRKRQGEYSSLLSLSQAWTRMANSGKGMSEPSKAPTVLPFFCEVNLRYCLYLIKTASVKIFVKSSAAMLFFGNDPSTQNVQIVSKGGYKIKTSDT